MDHLGVLREWVVTDHLEKVWQVPGKLGRCVHQSSAGGPDLPARAGRDPP